jgi:hypothetical protein
MKKLKHVKMFENFIINEAFQDDESIISYINHLIKYSTYDGELYAGQNMNTQQIITQNEYPEQRNYRKDVKPGKLIGQSNIDYPYFIGNNEKLNCYNCSFSDDKNGLFLSAFNRKFKTNYTTLGKI